MQCMAPTPGYILLSAGNIFSLNSNSNPESALSSSTIVDATKINSTPASAPEWLALLECSSPLCNDSHLLQLLETVSWPLLLNLAEQHGVVALLASALQHGPGRVAPTEYQQKIRELHRAQVLATLKMTAELFRLVNLYRSSGLDALLVKGPTLALRAYGDTGARHYGDLDFLVRQRDILRATELMISAGYQNDISLDAIRAEKIPGQYTFVRIAAPLLVELHTQRTMRYFPRGLPVEDFFARRQLVPVDNHEIPALAIEDELVLICIHGAKHLWDRLTMVADVAAYAARQTALDWERCFATAQKIGASRMLNTGLLLAGNLLRAPLPSHIASRIQADSSAARLAKQIAAWLPAAGHALPGLVARALFRARMRGSAAAGLGYLLRLTFSPTQEDWSSDEQTPPETSHSALAALRRPLRLAKKYRGGKTS